MFQSFLNLDMRKNPIVARSLCTCWRVSILLEFGHEEKPKDATKAHTRIMCFNPSWIWTWGKTNAKDYDMSEKVAVSILLEFGHEEKPYRNLQLVVNDLVSILLEFGHEEKQLHIIKPSPIFIVSILLEFGHEEKPRTHFKTCPWKVGFNPSWIWTWGKTHHIPLIPFRFYGVSILLEFGHEEKPMYANTDTSICLSFQSFLNLDMRKNEGGKFL